MSFTRNWSLHDLRYFIDCEYYFDGLTTNLICNQVYILPMSQSIQYFDRVLENIMHTDKQIRSATIFDNDGNELDTRIRDGVEPFLNDMETKETLRYAANAWKIRRTFAPKIGKGRYVLAVYESLRRLTMPLGDRHLIMVTWGIDGGSSQIIEHLENMFSGDPTKDW